MMKIGFLILIVCFLLACSSAPKVIDLTQDGSLESLSKGEVIKEEDEVEITMHNGDTYEIQILKINDTEITSYRTILTDGITLPIKEIKTIQKIEDSGIAWYWWLLPPINIY